MIIIGAGAAGLTAARELSAAGVSVAILEARDRVGGRIHTKYSDDVPIELGAEFIHGTPNETFAITDAADLRIMEADWSPWHVTDEGTLIPSRDFDPAGDEEFWEALDEYQSAGKPDISLESFLNGETDLSAESRKVVEGYVGGFHAAEIDKIGVRGLVKTEVAGEAIDGDRAFRFSDGYENVTEFLWRQAKENGTELHLNTVVKNVKWSSFGVKVTALQNGESTVFRAKKLISTLPIGVLKASSEVDAYAQFEPPLNSKTKAIEKIESGAAVRITFYFESKWWLDILQGDRSSEVTMGFLFAQKQFVPVWWANEPSDFAILTGWAGGERAKQLCAMDEPAMIEQATECLAAIFSVEPAFIREQTVTVHSHNWQRDEFSLGSYSYMGVGGEDVAGALAENIENVLFFAGEATSGDGHWGTVHGALASGIRAAGEVKSALGK